MQNVERHWFVVVAGVLFVVAAAGAVWFLFPRNAVAPLPSASEALLVENAVVASSTPKSVVVNRPVSHPLPLAKGDSIASWDFKGAYTGNPELVAKAQAEIKRFSDLLATATSSSMILSVAIANEYELLGKGKEQYDYLGRAVRSDAKNGLPWHNLGVLMERLHAYETARIAYERSATFQPQSSLYHYAYLEFLLQNMKSDTADIEKAFTAAETNLGKTPYLLELRAKWEKS